jgi:arylsulfatase A-like enzyme
MSCSLPSFLIAVGAALWVGSTVPSAPAAPASKPNILLIVADDMGFSDAGCYGGEIQTPNLDRLARDGLRFTQFYNTARCWPSRACILTGYYAQQVRRDALPGLDGGATGQRPSWARLLPEMLRPLGYRSYHSGKWHVDGKVLAGGFERSYSLTDFNRYFNPQEHELDDQPLPAVKAGSGYYATTAIAQHAIEMLTEHQARHADQPFFLYLAFTSPHFPLHALPQDIAIYRDRYRKGWDEVRRERSERQRKMGLLQGQLSERDPVAAPSWNLTPEKLRQRIGPGEVGRALPWNDLTSEEKEFQAVKMSLHAAMIHRMDIEIGRVLEHLRKARALQNTLIAFVSDNGASAEQIIRGDLHDPQAPAGSAESFLCLGPGWSTAANTPFRLHKSWVHEGGIATPLIVSWPRGIRARGALRTTPGHLIDLAPTLLEVAGGRWPEAVEEKPVPPPPGKSLLPVFSKDGSLAHEYLWWCHDTNCAIRVADWKLVRDHQKPWELYNLAQDRTEGQDLAAALPEKVAELEREWTKHMEEFRVLALEDLSPEQRAAITETKQAPDK